MYLWLRCLSTLVMISLVIDHNNALYLVFSYTIQLQYDNLPLFSLRKHFRFAYIKILFLKTLGEKLENVKNAFLWKNAKKIVCKRQQKMAPSFLCSYVLILTLTSMMLFRVYFHIVVHFTWRKQCTYSVLNSVYCKRIHRDFLYCRLAVQRTWLWW